MNITIVCDVLGEENNGTTITAKRLINSLKERGHRVKVISPSHEDGLDYYEAPALNFGIFNKYVAKNGVRIAKADKKLLQAAIDGAEVVHILLPFSLGKAAIKMCVKQGIPVTAGMHTQAENVTSHFFLKNIKFVNDFVYWAMRRVLYRYVDAIHCPSNFISHVAKDHGYKAPTYVISNGVIPLYKPMDCQRPTMYEGRYLILFIGRFSREKRHDILVRAVHECHYRDKIQLIFAGSGPLEQSIKHLSQRLLKHQPVMKFFQKEELVQVINYCDLYVHPSDAEIEAISCIEAMSCGLVPVISDSPRSATNAFALSKNNLFDHRHPSDLARKIEYWIENEALKQRASVKYIEYAKRYAISGSIDKMEGMFRDVIKKKTGR
ncbi:MAG: glycosyltransferase [Bacilli bacterium]